VRTLKLVAPLALGIIASLYMLINIAYFGVISKEDILESKRITGFVSQVTCRHYPTDILFQNQSTVFQKSIWAWHRTRQLSYLLAHSKPLTSSQLVSIIIALSTLGNCLAVQFAYGRGKSNSLLGHSDTPFNRGGRH
jgi:amino acid transporter